MNFKKINIAEFFALIRVFTFPVVLFFIFRDNRMTSAILFLLLFSTDALDGFFAKILNQETDRRQKLDTNGDILFLFTGLAGFYIFENEFFEKHLPWIVTVLSMYALQFVISMIKFGKRSYFHTYSAKLAAFFQVLFLTYMLFFTPVEWLFYAATIISCIDAVEDIIIVLKVDKLKMNIKGFWWLHDKA